MKSTFLAKKLGLPVLAVSTALMFTGCGSSNSTSTPAANNVAVNGVAVKGPFLGSSTVSVFGLKNGTKSLIQSSTTSTDGSGSFTVTVPKQAGTVVIVEVDGPYKSETGAANATGTISSVAFLSGTTDILADLLVTPVSHIVANIVEKNPHQATRQGILDIATSVGNALGLTGINVLGGSTPADFSTTANSTVLSAATTTQKQMGAVIAGFEKLRGTDSYNSFFATRLSTQTTNGLIPSQFQTDLVSSIASQIASIASYQSIFENQDSVFQNLTSTATWTTTGIDMNLHRVDLFANEQTASIGHNLSTSMTAGQQMSIRASISASASANLTYILTVHRTGFGEYNPITSVLSGIPATGAVTGSASLNGIFTTTTPGTYTIEIDVRQTGRTEIAKGAVTNDVHAVPVVTPPTQNQDTNIFSFGNFTSAMINGKKFHTSYTGKADSIENDAALRQVVSFLTDGSYVRVRYAWAENANDLPTTGQGNYAARGTWEVKTEAGFGVIRMNETKRFAVAGGTISTTATAVTSDYRIVLDPAATANNLQLKFIRTKICKDQQCSELILDPQNPFKDDIAGMFGSADIFTPSKICGGDTSLGTLPATTSLLKDAGNDSTATGCTTVPN